VRKTKANKSSKGIVGGEYYADIVVENSVL